MYKRQGLGGKAIPGLEKRLNKHLFGLGTEVAKPGEMAIKITNPNICLLYTSKIGLSDKYEDQERVYKRLEKNEEVKDKNTSNLNASILSKYVNENQKDVYKRQYIDGEEFGYFEN